MSYSGMDSARGKWRNICMPECAIGYKQIKYLRKILRYWWRWFYLKYVKVIITAVITAIIEIVGELYVEHKRRG